MPGSLVSIGAMRNPILLFAVVLPVSSAFAKPPAADWLGKSATFTNADVVNSRGGPLGGKVTSALPATCDAQTVLVTLLDRQGLTHVEVLCSSTGIYELQNGSEFTRRGALGTLHANVFAALTGKKADADDEDGASAPSGAGVFGAFEAPPSAGEKMTAEFIKSREPEDVIVTLGWTTKEGAQVYGSLYADRIELNADAPKAAKK